MGCWCQNVTVTLYQLHSVPVCGWSPGIPPTVPGHAHQVHSHTGSKRSCNGRVKWCCSHTGAAPHLPPGHGCVLHCSGGEDQGVSRPGSIDDWTDSDCSTPGPHPIHWDLHQPSQESGTPGGGIQTTVTPQTLGVLVGPLLGGALGGLVHAW